MIDLYQKYLEEKLKQAGIKRVCLTMKELKSSNDILIGAVIIDKDTFSEEKQNKIYYSNDDVPIKRIKTLNRQTSVNVIIGESEPLKCDCILVKFLETIDVNKGIHDSDGNHIDIEIKEADWVSDSDSILRSTMAVQLPIVFHGGIYKDYDFKQINWKGNGEYAKRK